jgi:hypothetical protein
MNTTAQQALNTCAQSRTVAAVLAVTLTLAMLLGVDHLATSEAPASLLAQVTSPRV